MAFRTALRASYLVRVLDGPSVENELEAANFEPQKRLWGSERKATRASDLSEQIPGQEASEPTDRTIGLGMPERFAKSLSMEAQ